jgi:hypothetical protein
MIRHVIDERLHNRLKYDIDRKYGRKFTKQKAPASGVRKRSA